MVKSLPVLLCAALILAGCHRPAPVSDPLRQRGYLWQRDWTPAVSAAAIQAEQRFDGGIVILGAEIRSEPAPAIIASNIDWNLLHTAGKPVSIAVRVDPFAGENGPVSTIADAARMLLGAARSHGVEVAEFQIDYDCPQRKLASYRQWLRALKPALNGKRLVITTLPAWLDEPDFPALLDEADGYVLQVHSVPTRRETGRSELFDPALARKWVAKAAALGRPFSVALPTYRCLAGYSPAGNLLSVAMDSIQPVWPPGTRVLDFSTDANAVAGVVRDWLSARPALLRELIWYRIPVATDALNWRWPTFLAVMAGREPRHNLTLASEGANPIDISISNDGEADEQLGATVEVTASQTPVASDALPGWTLRLSGSSAIFVPGEAPRLPPGAKRNIGWLRYQSPPPSVAMRLSSP